VSSARSLGLVVSSAKSAIWYQVRDQLYGIVSSFGSVLVSINGSVVVSSAGSAVVPSAR
jgi:hypothetical protein